jgi:chemotaxis signal transduction protein
MDHASNAPRLRLAQARIGAVHLGIPVAGVVQAIPVPDTLALLPLRGKALRGVVEHGGALLPVIDLGRWVDVGSAASVAGDSARILVLREGGRTIGLQVDALGGLIEVAAGQAVRLHHEDDPDDVFHSAVQAPDGGAILSLLEIGRLADLAAAWSEAARAAAPETPGAGGAAAAERAGAADAGASLYALLDTGQGLLGVAPADLAEVIPMPALERLAGGIGATYCAWRGRHLAVLPGAALMAAQDDAVQGADADKAPLLAVFVHAGLALGVPMRAVRQLQAFGPGLPVPGGVTSAVFDADGGEVRLLDTARLFARYPEAALSKPEADAGAAASTAAGKAGSAANACAYIVFEADGVKAVPIGAVEHIVPLAQAATASMAWRGTAIPLADLRTRASAHDAEPGHVLVARGPQGHVGYVVTRVLSLIPAGAGQMYRMGGATGAGRRVEFITAGEGSAQASYRIVELAAAAAPQAA